MATLDDRPRTARRARLATLVAVVGPGLLAGLSDDDPAGITTYSVLGADYGYQLLWVLLLSTIALVLFHDLAARMGVATGQGLLGLVRDRYGVRTGGLALVVLVAANLGTACAELAGVAAGFELFGVSRYVSVPIAVVLVSVLVLRGRFHRVEHLLMALAAVFLAYVAAGLVVGPDWGRATRGLLLPTAPLDRDALLVVVATVGTTLAPWGLSFIQSYAVDKKLTPEDLPYERADVVTGSVLTGVIGFFVVVTCAETLHAEGVGIASAADAARALEPLAGRFAGLLFGVGLIGAAFLAAAVLPLSTAYSVCEFTGHEGALDDGFRRAPLFYSTFVLVAGAAAVGVLLPGVPLVPLLVLTQVLNAVLLVPLLVLMYLLSRDDDVMGGHAAPRAAGAVYLATIGFITLCVTALLVLGLT
ncbi:NRAMP family divalent metal transporter [Nocardia sp. N13]|uniref:NRAMP family divalent metal transporter n=1 Tax=Nocardioides sp. N13(2025) TaxID=3453405 RepID=UPI003F76678D